MDPKKILNHDFESWRLEKDAKGIKVYTKLENGEVLAKVKIRSNITHSMSSVVALFLDVPGMTSWVYNCGKSNIIERISDTEMVNYQLIKAPWPVSDRDMVVKMQVIQDPKTKVVKVHSVSVPDYIPEVSGVVRIPKMESTYHLVPLADGTIELDYYLHFDPGGLVPEWLVNSSIVLGPYNSTEKMLEKIRQDRYQEARFDFITDPKK